MKTHTKKTKKYIVYLTHERFKLLLFCVDYFNLRPFSSYVSSTIKWNSSAYSKNSQNEIYLRPQYFRF